MLGFLSIGTWIKIGAGLLLIAAVWWAINALEARGERRVQAKWDLEKAAIAAEAFRRSEEALRSEQEAEARALKRGRADGERFARLANRRLADSRSCSNDERLRLYADGWAAAIASDPRGAKAAAATPTEAAPRDIDEYVLATNRWSAVMLARDARAMEHIAALRKQCGKEE